MTRKLAKIVLIDEIKPIDNADNIELAVCGGWKCVVKKGEFSKYDKVIYFEIDSFIPHSLAPFLSKGKSPKIFNSVFGERLKTIKLRGVLSQGLIMPLSILDSAFEYKDITIGKDLTEHLNIQLWEPMVSPPKYNSNGDIISRNFPIFVPKTDQERVQNLKYDLEEYKAKELVFEVTEKLDGSSMTVYVNGDESGVCSRNLDLEYDDSNKFWHMEKKYDIINKIKSLNRNLAIQGELIGEKVQNNYYKIDGNDFYVFDIYDIDNKCYLNAPDRLNLCSELNLKRVPVLAKYSISKFTAIDDILLISEGTSTLNSTVEREGIVFKCIDFPDIHFKAISNKFLLKHQ